MNLRRALPLLALLPAIALAQPRGGQHDPREPRIIFFEQPNFQGGAIVLYAGESAENLARWDFDNGHRANDRISSIRVEGAEAMVFTDANFRGDALRVTTDIRDLARGDSRGVRFNNLISSIRVDFARPPERRPRDERPREERPPAIDPDKIVRRAYQDILEREPDASGLREFRSRIIDRGWTEKQVRDALRASDEYRGPYMTRRLNRIYRELLGRDVDPRGFDHYRNKIIEHDWTDEDIRRDIKNGAEYRNRPRPQPDAPRRAQDAPAENSAEQK
jgi:hypothetical protein